MKILVDELPKNANECVFSEYDLDYGYRLCTLSDGIICNLHFNRPCEQLKTIENAGKKENENIMTRVKLDDYCKNCPDFKAACEQTNNYADGSMVSVEVEIGCKYKNHCKYLQKE